MIDSAQLSRWLVWMVRHVAGWVLIHKFRKTDTGQVLFSYIGPSL